MTEHRYPDSFRHSGSDLTDPIEDEDDDEDEYEKASSTVPPPNITVPKGQGDHKGRDQEPIFRFCLRALCDLSVL
ncbi:MAG TPA: hypothetical protein VF020_22945 [Chthoniobacterales bacterium]